MDFKTNLNTIFNGVAFVYPSSYTIIKEGVETIGFAKMPGTIGVLRASPYIFGNMPEATQVLQKYISLHPQGISMDFNGRNGWFYTEEKMYGSNDHLFWPETHPMSMYFYAFQKHTSVMFFSYRIPAYMEDDGQFDQEHALVMEIIMSSAQ